MTRPVLLVLIVSAAAGGCSGGGLPSSATTQPMPGTPLVVTAKKSAHYVYWTLYAGRTYPEVQIAKTPMKKKSKVVNIAGGAANDLNYTSGMTFDKSGRLWILSFGHYAGNPATAVVFKLPVKPPSNPEYEFVLSGSDGSDAITFDPSGNLWVSSPGNNDVLEYTGPLTKRYSQSGSNAQWRQPPAIRRCVRCLVEPLHFDFQQHGLRFDRRRCEAVHEQAVLSRRTDRTG